MELGRMSAIPFCFFGERDLLAAMTHFVASLLGLALLINTSFPSLAKTYEVLAVAIVYMIFIILGRENIYHVWFQVIIKNNKHCLSTYKTHLLPQILFAIIPLYLILLSAASSNIFNINDCEFHKAILGLYALNFLISSIYAQATRNTSRDFLSTHNML